MKFHGDHPVLVVEEKLSFQDVYTFIQMYEKLLNPNGLMVSWYGDLPKVRDLKLDIRPPFVWFSCNSNAKVLLTHPQGTALDLSEIDEKYKERLLRFGKLCQDIWDEARLLSRAGNDTSQFHAFRAPGTLPPGREKPLPGFYPSSDTLSIPKKDINFPDVSTFMYEYYHNINQGGLFINWVNPPPVKSSIELELFLPHLQTPLVMPAKIVYVGDGGVGAELSEQTELTLEILEKYSGLCESIWQEAQTQPKPEVEEFMVPSQSSYTIPAPSPPSSEINAYPVHNESDFFMLGQSQADLHPPEDLSVSLAGQAFGQYRPFDTMDLPAAQSSDSIEIGMEDQAHFSREFELFVEQDNLQAPTLREVKAEEDEDEEPPPEPDSSKASWEGTLSQTSLTKILLKSSKEKYSGLLKLSNGTSEVEIALYKGRINRILGHPLAEETLLGEILAKQDKISRYKLQESLKSAMENGKRLGDELMARHWLKKRELAVGLRAQLEKRLASLVELTEGTLENDEIDLSMWADMHFAYYEDAPYGNAPVAPPTPPVRTLLNVRSRKYRKRTRAEVAAVESDFIRMYVHKAEGYEGDIGYMGLSDNQDLFWNEVLTGCFRLKEVASVSPLSRMRTHAFLFALRDFGFVEFRKKPHEMLEEGRILEMFEQKCRSSDRDSLFDLFEVHWASTDDEIKAGYEEVKKRYNHQKIAPNLEAKVVHMSNQLMVAFDRGYEKLKTRELRAVYRAKILSKEQIKFAKDLLVKQGDMEAYKQNHQMAAYSYDHALELDPKDRSVQQKHKASVQKAKANKQYKGLSLHKPLEGDILIKLLTS